MPGVKLGSASASGHARPPLPARIWTRARLRDHGGLTGVTAGGIADGRGVAAALALGAAGALIGTHFLATAEALIDPPAVKAIIEGSGEDTERNCVLDIARGSRWPSRYSARTLGHPFLDQWRGREAELVADPDARQAYQDGVARGDLPPRPVWASEAIDLINDLRPAADLVGVLAAQAERALTHPGSPASARLMMVDRQAHPGVPADPPSWNSPRMVCPQGLV